MAIIRKAILKDVDEIVSLWKNFMEEHREMGLRWGEDRIPEIRENAGDMIHSYFSKCIRSKNAFMLVLEDEGSIRGFMLSSTMKNIPIFKGDRVGFVSSIFIEGSLRGRRFSSMMLDETMKWFEMKGVSEVSLRVMCCNEHAYDIYTKWGFKDIHVEMRKEM